MGDADAQLRAGAVDGVPVFRLDERLVFPPAQLADDGLLAVGGDLRPERLLLAIRDNGCGISGNGPATSGMGLRVMRYRAAVLGGALAVERQPAGGTRVRCSIPGPDRILLPPG